MTTSDLASSKARFLTDTAKVTTADAAVRNAIVAALQHNPTYIDRNVDGQEFRKTFAQAILDVSDLYAGEVSDSEHVQTIQSIADALSQQFSGILKNGRLRIGTVQKALNLYLKTVWCMDETRATPPHCPVDGIILSKGGIAGTWTTLDSIEQYEEWIETLKKRATKAEFSNLSEWELAVWES